MNFVGNYFIAKKNVKPFQKEDGTKINYYNLTLADQDTYQSCIVSVKEDVYNSVEEKKSYTFSGSFGGMGKNRWWSINGIIK